MKILVTGAAGFIGSNFVHYWVDKYPQDEVRVIDSLTYASNIKNLDSVKESIKFIDADINDRRNVAQALKGVDTVVHFAAESHVDRSVFDPLTYWRTNVHGTLVLLEEAKKAKVSRFHHISTDEVYGELPLNSDLKFTEETPYSPRPDNLYALSKAEADKIVINFYKKTGLAVTISNCSNNYGPFQFPEKFVPIVITNLIDGFNIPVHGDGRNVRDWIHTYDHSSAVDLILNKGKIGQTYLIGVNNDRSNFYIAKRIAELYGKDEKAIKFVPDRHSNDRRYAIDASKIVTELGWKPLFSREKFEEGLKETIKWYKENQDIWRPLLKRKASIADSTGSISAYISLDRQTGKTKFEFDKVNRNNKKLQVINDSHEHFLEQNSIRYEIVMKNLSSKKWYQNSSDEIKKKINALGISETTFGYVEDLSSREDQINGDKILSLEKIEHATKKYGIFGIASWFLVEDENRQKRMEGFYSWCWGPKSGAKILTLLKRKGKIDHLILTRENKFPTGSVEYNLIGGLPQLNESVLDFIVRSFEKDLHLKVSKNEIAIDKIQSLGRVSTDTGMTNNRPNLYAVVVEIKSKKYASLKEDEVLEEEKGIVVWPITRLNDLINKCDDSYFLSSLTRFNIEKGDILKKNAD